MQQSGLVLTLSPHPQVVDHVIREVQRVGVFTLGELHGRRLVLALEADSPVVAEYWYGWLARLEGVRKVDIAFVSVEEPQVAVDVVPHKEFAHAS